MFYDRQVKYLDCLVRGERCGNAGFIKLEVRDSVCNINISITGLKLTDSLQAKVYIGDGDKECELCTMELMQGKGTKQLLRLDAGNIAGTGIDYRDLVVVKIPISAERELYGILENKVGQVSESAEFKVTTENEVVENKVVEDEVCCEAVQEEIGAESKAVQMTEPEQANAEAKQENPKSEPQMSLQDTKWKQLWAIYPHISPFRDKREFLSVGPGDFVILPEKYFRLVNNSFLLHGYYNYKHLILKRMEYKGESRYYIGVPGNFYDREKQVAVMFGFESFESLEEQSEAGDFGYYLMRIEL